VSYVADGDDPRHTLGDVIIEVDPAGAIVNEWKSWLHLDPAIDVICPLDHRLEWGHCNSLSLTPAGDWLLSFRRFSMVVELPFEFAGLCRSRSTLPRARSSGSILTIRRFPSIRSWVAVSTGYPTTTCWFANRRRARYSK
jgi:hypothetical protein